MKPYYEHGGITIYHADAREAYREIGYGADHSIFLDPPYNAKKAEWDDEFPYWLFDLAACIGPTLAVTPGINNLLRCPSALCGVEYRWCLSAHLINGTTRGQIGFANWMPCLLYARPGFLNFKPRQDCKDFPILNDPKPDHPCPKPYGVMRWFLSFLPGDTIVDFFVGSGTTLKAAKDLGKKAIGIDINERYCEVAAGRLAQETLDFVDGQNNGSISYPSVKSKKKRLKTSYPPKQDENSLTLLSAL